MSFKPMSATNVRQSGIARCVRASREGDDMNYGQMMLYRADFCKQKAYPECEECQGWWVDIERCDSDHR